nr:hypothetical protein [uncultured Bacteroides sp.]
MEIGSFIELQLPQGKEFYFQQKDLIRLNTGRAAIWHAFRVTEARTIWLPYYQCDTVRDFLKRKGVDIKYYHIDENFNPIDLHAKEEDVVMFVNYYGIMSQERMRTLSISYPYTIIDNCQAFYCKPLPNAMNVYSCRKFIGVPDGAYVIGKNAHKYTEEYPQGFSSDTAAFLLKRIEYGCEGKGYEARCINEHRIDVEDIMKMSKLTHTILDGTDYNFIKNKRRENFQIANDLFKDINLIDATRFYDNDTIPMVYPLVVKDDDLLPRLQRFKHFQGHWWNYICEELPIDTFEYWMSRYMIPITIDQRYGRDELMYLANIIKK